MEKKKEKTGKTGSAKSFVTGSALAAIAAAGLTLGVLFSSPDDLLNKDLFVTPPFEISDVMLNEDNSDGPDISPETEQEKKQRGIRASLRRILLQIPLEVRAFAGVPIWVVGRVLLVLLGVLLKNVLAPAWMTILKYLCIAGLVLAAILLSVKAAFPDMPLKKLVTGKRIAVSAALAVFFGAVGVLLQVFWPEAMKTYEIIESCLITVIVVLVGYGILKIRKKKVNAA